VTPAEARAELAARTEAWKRLTASLDYITRRYGRLTDATAPATAYLQQVSHAWYAAGGSSAAGGQDVSAGLAQVPGTVWGSAGGSAAGSVTSSGGSGSASPGPGGGGGFTQVPGVAWGSAGGSTASPGLTGGGGRGARRKVISRAGAATDGFSDSEPPVVAGSVTGYRWWTITAPDLAGNPLDADQDWDPDYAERLHGAWAAWQPGVNRAVCLAYQGEAAGHDPALIPLRSCGCGYWAYWGLQQSSLNRPGALPVFGVIKGFGRTRTGAYGFRAAKARILAVHLPLVIGNKQHMLAELCRREREQPEPQYCRDPVTRALRASPLFTGKVISIGASYAPEPVPVPQFTEEEIAADKAKAEAWLAVIGDRLGQLYPGVRVFETRDALLRTFPPDAVYGQG
jgi:hypothetical protein